jgi:hypothetical protein
LVAEVAVATSISPVDLLEAPAEVFWAIVAVLTDRAKDAKKVHK